MHHAHNTALARLPTYNWLLADTSRVQPGAACGGVSITESYAVSPEAVHVTGSDNVGKLDCAQLLQAAGMGTECAEQELRSHRCDTHASAILAHYTSAQSRVLLQPIVVTGFAVTHLWRVHVQMYPEPTGQQGG